MKITCFIRYQIDPAQKEAFRAYAEAWGHIIPRCGGELVGYFLPWEGPTTCVGAYQLREPSVLRGLSRAPEGRSEARSNFEAVAAHRFILREERTFAEVG